MADDTQESSAEYKEYHYHEIMFSRRHNKSVVESILYFPET